MKLNIWYQTNIERAYPYYEDNNKVKLISWFVGVPHNIRDAEEEMFIWEHHAPRLSKKDYSRDCIKAIFI